MKTSFVILSLAALLQLRLPSLAGEKPLTGAQVYENGKAALDRGDLVTARRCFEQLLKAQPGFELAKIQLAQVVVAERELAKIPKVLKVARTQVLARVEFNEATLAEAAVDIARRLEKAGASPVNVASMLPEAVSKRPVTLSAANATCDQVLEAIGYANGLQINYTPQGLALRVETGARQQFDAGDPKLPAFSGAAQKIVLDRISFAEASLPEALAYLQRKAAEVSAGKAHPVFVIRHDAAPRSAVTLDLRNVSLHDAVASVCLVTDLEVKWFPWGAGIGNRQAAAAVTSPDAKAAPAPKP